MDGSNFGKVKSSLIPILGLCQNKISSDDESLRNVNCSICVSYRGNRDGISLHWPLLQCHTRSMALRLVFATGAVVTCAWFIGPLTTLVGFLVFLAAPVCYSAYLNNELHACE